MSDRASQVLAMKPGHHMECLGLELEGVGTIDFSFTSAAMYVYNAQACQLILADPDDTLSGVMDWEQWWRWSGIRKACPQNPRVLEICYQLWVPDNAGKVMRGQNYLHQCKHPTWINGNCLITTSARKMFKRESLGFLVDAPKSFSDRIKAIQFIN